MSVSVVGRAPAEMIVEGNITHKFKREKGHISHESRCLSPRIDWLQLLTVGLGGFRRGGGPSSFSDMADFSTEVGGWGGWMSLG